MFDKLALNPWVVRGILFLSMVVALFSAYEYGRYTQEATDKEVIRLLKKSCEGEKDKIRLDMQVKVDAANKTARATEQKLVTDLNLIQSRNYKERQNAQATIADLKRRIGDGSIRLRLPSGNTGNGLRAPEGSSIASASSAKEGTELLPEVANALIDITAGCDANVRDYNELLDNYTTVMNRINAPVVTSSTVPITEGN